MTAIVPVASLPPAATTLTEPRLTVVKLPFGDHPPMHDLIWLIELQSFPLDDQA